MEINAMKLAAVRVVSACPNAAVLPPVGLSGSQRDGVRFRGERRAAEFAGGRAFGGEVFGYEGLINERPTKASAAAAVAGVCAPIAAVVAADAAQTRPAAVISQKQSTTQTEQHHTMWAFRGPDPWRSPT